VGWLPQETALEGLSDGEDTAGPWSMPTETWLHGEDSGEREQ
jgi:hypothetical protein